MSCYFPLNAYRCQGLPVSFKPMAGWSSIKLPCGQCVGCRLERSRQWAVRCMHESRLYERNCFITLTYNDQNLPSDRGLHYGDFQKFMKRLRFSFKGHRPFADGTRPIRFYMCGEYGENFGRPHFHACIFNFDFEDKKLWMTTDSKSKLYRSASLEELWPFGFSSIGDVNFQSAAYVARYIMKKINGRNAHRHYVNPETGEILSPEFTKMSLKPGIGAGWFSQYKDDVYKFNSDGSVAQDSIFVNGKNVKPPRYYDDLLRASDVELSYVDSSGDVVTFSPKLDAIKTARAERAFEKACDNTPDRLCVKETVVKAQLSRLKRKLK